MIILISICLIGTILAIMFPPAEITEKIIISLIICIFTLFFIFLLFISIQIVTITDDSVKISLFNKILKEILWNDIKDVYYKMPVNNGKTSVIFSKLPNIEEGCRLTRKELKERRKNQITIIMSYEEIAKLQDTLKTQFRICK